MNWGLGEYQVAGAGADDRRWKEWEIRSNDVKTPRRYQAMCTAMARNWSWVYLKVAFGAGLPCGHAKLALGRSTPPLGAGIGRACGKLRMEH